MKNYWVASYGFLGKFQAKKMFGVSQFFTNWIYVKSAPKYYTIVYFVRKLYFDFAWHLNLLLKSKLKSGNLVNVI